VPAQKTNSAIVFVAVLIAAVIIVFAIFNRSGGPKTPEGSDATPPEPTPRLAEEDADDEGVTLIDQTTDTTNAPAAPDNTAIGLDQGEVVVPNFIDAAERGDVVALNAMIQGGADLNQTDEAGRTALMVAAGGGHIDAVFTLLNAGADPELRDSTRRSARDYALARYDEPGMTVARVIEGALGPAPVSDPTDK
jgi:hypothetical protein